jgi:hypothetical protein
MSRTSVELNGTKAETLKLLSKKGFPVPSVYYFTSGAWNENKQVILDAIKENFVHSELLAIRSSALAEDSSEQSMAGAFDSVLNVPAKDDKGIENAVMRVLNSYDGAIDNQVLVQPMVSDAIMSGVVMTKVLDDGSPYYVVNYDDSSGETDTVTSGMSINKTVYIYNGAKKEDFDSPYLVLVIELVLKLETVFDGIPLDIEFAIDGSEKINLLQVRPITTSNNWKHDANAQVAIQIKYLDDFVGKLMSPRPDLYGKKTLLGLMPDWNPAEMIGVVPDPLSMSLYRELITKSNWRIAREKMGYRKMPNVELMISLYGRTYIDVRNSMNSFLPKGLSDKTSEKLVNAYIQRLENNPHLADKVEFEVVPTAFDFQFEETFLNRYPGLLDRNEFSGLKRSLRHLTRKALISDSQNTLNAALKDIEHLKMLQNESKWSGLENSFSLSDHINSLVGECELYGTLPFAIIARHAFIAEGLLRSAVSKGVLEAERVALFRRSFHTVAGDLSEDFYKVSKGELDKESFHNTYGHLRPSSYDILSPRYQDREDLFNGVPLKPADLAHFELSKEEKNNLDFILAEAGFDLIQSKELLEYVQKAIVGREYAKFIFTKHLSNILENMAAWGELHGFSRSQMAMLTYGDIRSMLFAPFNNTDKNYYLEKIEKAKASFEVGSSFKLSYLIRSTRDLYVVPQQRSTPNFIGNKRIEGTTVLLNPYISNVPELEGKIVCIEGADPGYDWIFSRTIAGLVTKYGGANSHMAIRCAEYNLPAAIGCGEQPFERIVNAGSCLLDCQGKRLEPISVM